MTDTVKRTYVGIFDAVKVPALNDRIVKRGETIDVHKSVAGRPPTGKPGDEDYDPGEGLDAQPENWATPGSASAKKAAKKPAARRASKKTTEPPPAPDGTAQEPPATDPATTDATTQES